MLYHLEVKRIKELFTPDLTLTEEFQTECTLFRKSSLHKLLLQQICYENKEIVYWLMGMMNPLPFPILEQTIYYSTRNMELFEFCYNFFLNRSPSEDEIRSVKEHILFKLSHHNYETSLLLFNQLQLQQILMLDGDDDEHVKIGCFLSCCFNGNLGLAEHLCQTRSMIDTILTTHKSEINTILAQNILKERMMMVVYLLKLFPVLREEYRFKEAYISVAKQGNLSQLKWMEQQTLFDPQIIQRALQFACQQGRMEIVTYLQHSKQLTFDHHHFQNACVSGNLALAKYIYSCCNPCDLHYINHSELFKSVVKAGQDEIFQYLTELFPLPTLSEYLLDVACLSGHIMMVYRIYELLPDTINLITLNCIENYLLLDHPSLSILQFLHSKKVSLFESADKIFYFACRSGNELIVNWMLNTFTIQDVRYIQSSFHIICYHNQVDLAILLYEQFPVIINKIFKQRSLFQRSLAYRNTEILHWFCDVVPSFSIEMNDNEEVLSFNVDIPMYDVIGEIAVKKEMCCVCYEEEQLYSNCNHRYCEQCATKMLTLTSECAMCRQVISSFQKII